MTANQHRADVVVVGAGAAGLATAIFTARRSPDLLVVALDGARKIGAKILVSGGGRCNVTNVRVEPADFRGASPNTIRKILRSFTEVEAVAFFREIAVALHEEEHGKLFPDSNDAHTVLNALLNEAQRCGVLLLTEHRVMAVQRVADGFHLETSSGPVFGKRLVLATGGKSLPRTGSDGAGFEIARRVGHTIVDPVPALVPLILDGDFHAGLSGIAHDVALTVRVAGKKPITHAGAMLWTHFGVSGPVVLDVSGVYTRARHEQHETSIAANFLPGLNFQQAEKKFLSDADKRPRELLRNAFSAHLSARVVHAILTRLGLNGRTAVAHVSRDARRHVLHALLEWPLPVIGDRGYNHAEVTAGGVPLEEIDPGTMESRLCPGLSLVGEILNVDGRIGGFNFQWAWSTAAVAARFLAG